MIPSACLGLNVHRQSFFRSVHTQSEIGTLPEQPDNSPMPAPPKMESFITGDVDGNEAERRISNIPHITPCKTG